MKLSSLLTLSQHISDAQFTSRTGQRTRSLLLASVITLSLGAGALSAYAQGQATINLKNAAGATATRTGQILGVDNGKVNVRMPDGNDIAYNLSDVTSVSMPAPKEFEEANKFFNEGKNPLALAKYNFVVTQFKGLPTTWMSSAMARLGEVYINLNQFEKAEAVFADYAKIFGSGDNALPQADLGKAQIAFAQNKPEEARQLLEGVVEKAKSLEAVTEEQSSFFGRAYLTLGQVQEADKNYPEALESYLKVVTLYYRDNALVEAAQAKAKALRESQPLVSVP